MEKKYFIYLRQSKEDNSKNTFSFQKEAIVRFAESQGIKLDTSSKYCLWENASGWKDNRPQFEIIMRKLELDSRRTFENREYAGILFYNVSRISRNSEDFVRIEKFMEKGYRMLSSTENIVNSPSWMYFFRMIQVESIYFSEQQSSKSLSYIIHIISHNPYKNYGWSGVTYGYLREDTNIWIHPINSRIVKRIFALKEAGTHSHKDIGKTLQEEFWTQCQAYNAQNEKMWDEKKNKNTTRGAIESDEWDEESWIKDSDEFDTWSDEEFTNSRKKKAKRPYVPLAIIPSIKMLSSIINGTGSIQYEWKRIMTISLSFLDDAEKYNRLFSEGFSFKVLTNNGKFIKGDNLIEIETPNLKIIEKTVLNRVRGKIVRHMSLDSEEAIQIYKWTIFCSCGSHMSAKKEAGRRYYRCNRAASWGDCSKNTRMDEERISQFVGEEIFKYITISPDNTEFEKVIWELQKGRILSLKNAFKANQRYLADYMEKLDSPALLQDEALRKAYAFKYKDKLEENAQITTELEVLENTQKKHLSDFFHFSDIFSELDTTMKRIIVELALERITFTEIHSPEFQYDNPRNRKSIQYQKIITDVKLRPYIHELYLLNKYHGGIN